MQRLIRSFNTLTDALKETLQEQYPDGIDSTHIKTIPTAKGEILRVIELRTPDALYLIKINPESRAEIEEFLDQEDAAPVGDDIEEGGADLEAGDEGGDEEETSEEEDADDDGEEPAEEEVDEGDED
ncbi:MAG TPA: hypothetical protein PLN54_06750 [Flavobacteriales bacterium]|nr:hypothetical protein [Flavobacteriales bacterium]